MSRRFAIGVLVFGMVESAEEGFEEVVVAERSAFLLGE